MAQQRATIIDVTRSFLPGDPNAFPENMRTTQGEDAPEKAPPIMAFDGVNILPTAYGYRAYFGLNSKLDIAPLPSLCDKVLLFQNSSYQNILIALCADGIWAAGELADGWQHRVVLDNTWETDQVYKPYTWCAIENDLYIYRQGHSCVFKMDNNQVITPSLSLVPSSPWFYCVNTTGLPDEEVNLGVWRVMIAGLDPTTNAPALVSPLDSPAVPVLLYADSICHAHFDQIPGVDQYKVYLVQLNEDSTVASARNAGIFDYSGTGLEFVPNLTTMPLIAWPDASSGPATIAETGLDFTEISPSFLNMSGQMGIFRANGRLGFWDSANSVSWSSAFDFSDFTPAVETLAGNVTFFGVLGRIAHILSHGEGFIIYATKSIVGVGYTNSGTLIWDAQVITDSSGIYNRDNVTEGITSREHYAYTSTGIMKIGNFNALSRKYEKEDILPEFYDMLKENRTPIKLECLQGRYLAFCPVESNYISGAVISKISGTGTLVAPLLSQEAMDDLLESFSVVGDLSNASAATVYQKLYNLLRNPTGDLILENPATLDSFQMPLWHIRSYFPNMGADIRQAGFMLEGASYVRENVLNVILEQGYEGPANPTGYFDSPSGGVINMAGNPFVDLNNFAYDDPFLTAFRDFDGYDLPSTRVLCNSDYVYTPGRHIVLDDKTAIDHCYPVGTYPIEGYGPADPKHSCIDQIYGFAGVCDRYNTRVREVNAKVDEIITNILATQITIVNCWTTNLEVEPVLYRNLFYKYAVEQPHFALQHIPAAMGYSSTADECTVLAITASWGRNVAYLVAKAVPISVQKLSYLSGPITAEVRVVDYTFDPDSLPIVNFGCTLAELKEVSTIQVDGVMYELNIGSSDNGLDVYDRPGSGPLEGTYPVEYVNPADPTDVLIRNIYWHLPLPGEYSYNYLPFSGTWYDQSEWLYRDWIIGDLPEMLNPNYYLFGPDLVAHNTMLGHHHLGYSNGSSGPYNSPQLWALAIRRHGEYLGMQGFFDGVAGIAYPVTTAMGNLMMYNPSTINLEWDEDNDKIFAVANIQVQREDGWTDLGPKRIAVLSYDRPIYSVDYEVQWEIRDEPDYIKYYNSSMPGPGIAPEPLLVDSKYMAQPDAWMLLQHVGTQEIQPQANGQWAVAAEWYLGGSGRTGPANQLASYDVYGLDESHVTRIAHRTSPVDDPVSQLGIPVTDKQGHNWHLLKPDTSWDTGGAIRYLDFMSHYDGNILGVPALMGAFSSVEYDPVIGVTEPGFPESLPRGNYTLPGSTFVLQEGAPAGGYYTYKGAYVFDQALKKWGKFVADFDQLVSYSPINATHNNVIDFTNFGVDAGVLTPAGEIKLFDINPEESWIRYGKVGYYRLGFTNGEEVRAYFRTPFTGSIKIEGSLDGATLDGRLDVEASFDRQLAVVAPVGNAAKWYSIKISGQFDLNFLEFRGTIGSRR